jgi:hypothetical protein
MKAPEKRATSAAAFRTRLFDEVLVLPSVSTTVVEPAPHELDFPHDDVVEDHESVGRAVGMSCGARLTIKHEIMPDYLFCYSIV